MLGEGAPKKVCVGECGGVTAPPYDMLKVKTLAQLASSCQNGPKTQRMDSPGTLSFSRFSTQLLSILASYIEMLSCPPPHHHQLLNETMVQVGYISW